MLQSPAVSIQASSETAHQALSLPWSTKKTPIVRYAKGDRGSHTSVTALASGAGQLGLLSSSVLIFTSSFIQVKGIPRAQQISAEIAPGGLGFLPNPETLDPLSTTGLE